jgi:hypothetical protein
MVAFHLLSKNRIFEFPFWAGVLALGWFYPMAIGGYVKAEHYPEAAYANGMLFATLCTVALWIGFAIGTKRIPRKPSWIDAQFDLDRLFSACALLTVGGLLFYWKLQSLPEEMLRQSQWSGATVKYLFLSSVFQFGFIGLWILYLSQDKFVVPKILLFWIPGLLLILRAAVLGGRRAEMMNLVSFIFTSLWFVRRKAPPPWMIAAAVGVGLVLANSIGTYRGIMKNKELSLSERLKVASKADYTSESKNLLQEGGGDFNNYIYLRQVTAEDGRYDFGLSHWNGFIFNYVPAQIVGRGIKNSLMIPLKYYAPSVAYSRYGHRLGVGSVTTGYYDAFASFWWLGFIKFWLVGWLMGVLYKRAMVKSFLGMLLYAYMLGPAMHAISHGTHLFLVTKWAYFFMLAYPVLYWAKQKVFEVQVDVSESGRQEYQTNE